MPAERAGYTVTMFLVDVSASMARTRLVEFPDTASHETNTKEITNLEWALQFVKLKIQEMIYNGRKTDQCGVILFGSEETNNIINSTSPNGGYEHVSEYIPIGQANADTLAKISALRPSDVSGDPIDALIVGIETQRAYLANKKSWTRKIVLVTDGENPIEIEDWDKTVEKMNDLSIGFVIVGVDFDDEELPFKEEDKSVIKRANESFFAEFVSKLDNGLVGTCALALRETVRPDVRSVKSALTGNVLRLGDTETRPEEALEILVKTSKCTAVTRPKSWKRFARREAEDEDDAGVGMDVDEEETAHWSQLKMRTEYYVDPPHEEGAEDAEEDEGAAPGKERDAEKVEKEQLVRGFKYGSTYAPCPEGQFPKLSTRKGIDICGFFLAKNFRRELAMGEVQYIWADPGAAAQQIALSSVVRAMDDKQVLAIGRWVTRDGMDPKMGVLAPTVFDKVDCLLWAPMPFADDVRKYTFASLDHLVTKAGEVLTKHPYLPTDEQLDAMDAFVDAMDLMDAGEKDEEGVRAPWFDTRLSYNPAVHRTKQALFHSAVVEDLQTNPLPPPHPELLKYFAPPKRVLRRARDATEECIQAFKIKEVPKKVAKTRKDEHVRAHDDDEGMLLLDKFAKRSGTNTQASPSRASQSQAQSQAMKGKGKAAAVSGSASETEDDDDEDLLLSKPKPNAKSAHLPTPGRSPAPSSHGAMDVDADADPDLDLDAAGRAPGRIVGATRPLADFRANVARGDVVTKAVEDLGFVIRDVATRPFAARRHAELLECMVELRDVALKEDEIDLWNSFLRELKTACRRKKLGNAAFWRLIADRGRDLSLISDLEASAFGGVSSVSEDEAESFIQS